MSEYPNTQIPNYPNTPLVKSYNEHLGIGYLGIWVLGFSQQSLSMFNLHERFPCNRRCKRPDALIPKCPITQISKYPKQNVKEVHMKFFRIFGYLGIWVLNILLIL